VSAINDGGPAFPIPIAGCNDGGVYNVLEQSGGKYGGMTLRDWFAGQALAGIIANEGMFDHAIMLLNAEACYNQADAMLAARKGGAQ